MAQQSPLRQFVHSRRKSLESLESEGDETPLLTMERAAVPQLSLHQKIQQLLPETANHPTTSIDIFDSAISQETVVGHGRFLFRAKSAVDIRQLRKAKAATNPTQSTALHAIENVLDDVNAFINDLDPETVDGNIVPSAEKAPSIKSIHVEVSDVAHEFYARGTSKLT